MLKNLLKKKEFKSDVKDFYNRHKEKILDIVLFGSATKGKEKPADIDLMIIYRDKEDFDSNYELKKLTNASVTGITYEKLISPQFIAKEGYLLNGYSLVFDKKMSEAHGFESKTIIRYDLNGLNKSQRMRFYYALLGRDYKSGIMKELNAVKLSDNVIMIESEKEFELTDFFKYWKIKYIIIPVLIPTRIAESNALR